MPDRIDWTKRQGYVRARHGVETAWADEAVSDMRAAWIDLDPASASGRSVRVIGHSSAADDVLTVILLPADTDPDDRPTGEWWGANAWRSNARDRRIYEQEHEGRNGA